MSWQKFSSMFCGVEALGLSLDVSRAEVDVSRDFTRAFDAMEALEKGAVANPDEGRQVGHYWLRAPALATAEARPLIEGAIAQVKAFAAQVHREGRFKKLLVIGIGGSALGPQLAADALTTPDDKLTPYFFDNTDPDGFDRVLAQLGDSLAQTLVLVISKSGGTKETRNGMLEAQAAFARAGLDFAKHAVAVTGEGSALHRASEGWLARFPMWDWVGGRTSQTSAVGLLPAALQGFDIDALLEGARVMDEATRVRDVRRNPAALLALTWVQSPQRDLVVLPYKDRLLLLSRYLQQLVMESIGKEKDLDGRVVEQGLTVYGNKGSTDQHAYVQQLRDGLHNHFVLFIEVLKDRAGGVFEVEPGVTSGDYLTGFLLGTREALTQKGRASLTLTLPDTGARTLGAVIALFERAVGFYAALANLNAYHQPGVEAGKKAAEAVLAVQQKVLSALSTEPRDAPALAAAAGVDEETAFLVLRHLSANGRVRAQGFGPTATFSRS